MAEKLFEILDDDFDINSIDIYARWTHALDEFANSEAKKIKFSLKNQKEKNCCRNAIYAYKKNKGYDWTVFSERNKYNIYVVRS